MFYSYQKQYPIRDNQIPDRIRLSTGMTRSDRSTFTEEELIDAGYIQVDPPPDYNLSTQVLTWEGDDWLVRDMTAEESTQRKENKWIEIRNTRNNMIKDVEWRVSRYLAEMRMGLTPSDDIAVLDTYIQSLRDVTLQEDPFDITWPTIASVYDSLQGASGNDTVGQ